MKFSTNYSRFRRKHTALITVVIFAVTCELVAQGQTPVLNNIVSPSPNAASMAEYAEIPVNLHTGVPSIHVPIHVIASKKLKWPVSINYHSAGIKVAETGGVVGLGWSLQATGVVTRVMRGLPDEDSYFDHAATIPDDTDIIALSVKNDLATGIEDMLPDFFYYNVGGSGGRIIFDNNLIPRTIPREDVKVSVSNLSTMHSFSIVQPDGTIFYFADTETTSTYLLGPDPGPFKSTWYLTKIISPDLTDTISFNYSSYSYTYTTNEQESIALYYNVPYGASKTQGQRDEVNHASQTIISDTKLLSSIEYHGGKLEFINSNRSDDGSKKLDNIIVYFKDPQTGNYIEEKRFNFTYGYFDNIVTQGGGTRLRLDTLQEVASGNSLPHHQFSYSADQLPGKDSFAQDHWGYYNGKSGNDGLIPEFRYMGQPVTLNNRDVDPAFGGACIIKKIISPMLGETEFLFEPNQYLDGTDNYGPGLRIKKVIRRDPFTNINSVTNYEYKRPSDGKSSGKLVDNPQYQTGMQVKDQVGMSTYTYDCTFNNARPTGIGNFPDSPILYEYVTTYQGDALTVSGKTMTKFNVYNPGLAGYPYVPLEDLSWAAGKVVSQEYYKVEGVTETLVSRTENTYLVSPQEVMIKGLKVAHNKVLINAAADNYDFTLQNYITWSRFQYLSQSKTSVYEENSGSIAAETTTNYYIDPELDHTMPVRITTQTSDNNILLQKEISYPADYTTGVFAAMKNLNMIAMPVESKTIVVEGGNEFVTGYERTSYHEWTPDRIYPQYSYGSKFATPVQRSTFNANPNNYLQLALTINEYSDTGHPIEIQAEGGTPMVTVIDPYHQSVIAQCANASIEQVAYAGFETPYHGEWAFTKGTSQQVGNVNLSISSAQTSFSIQAGQTVNYTYSVTRTAGPSPVLTFSKPGATSIQHTLSLPSGSGNAALSPGLWDVAVSYEWNVSAFSVSFPYNYTSYHSINLSTDAKTGGKSLLLGSGHILSKSGLPAGNYSVSYYQKDGTASLAVKGAAQVLNTETFAAEVDGWQLIRKTINLTNTTDGVELSSPGSCKIDEVRLQPEGTFMNSMSYDARGRKVTDTDENLRSRFVEYDEWNRIKLVRNHDRDIVLHHEYQMAGD